MALNELEQYRALSEQAPSMVWRSGLDAKCDYCNATWLAFTGRSLESEIGDGWACTLHAADRKRYLALYLAHFQRREGFHTEVRLRRHRCRTHGFHEWRRVHARGSRIPRPRTE